MYFLLGISPASNCSWPTFRNPVSVPSSKAGCTVHPAFEDGTDTGFRNVDQLQFDAGEIPRRKYTIFKSRRKSEIKACILSICCSLSLCIGSCCNAGSNYCHDLTNVHLCSKKRPNFLNSSPTSTEGTLRLLSAPNGRF